MPIPGGSSGACLEMFEAAPELGSLGGLLTRLLSSSVGLGIAFAEPPMLLCELETSSCTSLRMCFAPLIGGVNGGLVLLGGDAMCFDLLLEVLKRSLLLGDFAP